MLVHRSNHSDDLLNQAIAAARQLPVPDGPSAEIAAQTLAALREAAQQPETTLLQRVRHMPWTSKAIAVLATAASLLAVYVGLSSFGGTALAFADVARVLNEVRSATWKITSEVKGLRNYESVRYLGAKWRQLQVWLRLKELTTSPLKVK